MRVPEITNRDLENLRQSGVGPLVLDVREADELAHGHLPEAMHIPLGELPDRFDELDRNGDWVIVCRSGGRSGQATAFLLGQGFKSVKNLVGGMNAWAEQIDTTMQVY